MKNSLNKILQFILRTLFLNFLLFFSSFTYSQSVNELEKQCNSRFFTACTLLALKYDEGDGVRLMPISDLEKRFESKQLDSTLSADYKFISKLLNED